VNRRIYDSSHLYLIENNRLQKKKRIKKYMLLFIIIEILVISILVVCALVTVDNKGKIALKELLENMDEAKTHNYNGRYLSNRIYGVASPLVKRIHTHEKLVDLYLNGTSPSVSKPPKPNNTPMPVEENIKYYMFSLYDNSYKYSVFYDTEISVETGIKDDIEKELVAGYKSELRYGSLKVVNDYVRDPINIREILQAPLVIKKPEKGKSSILIFHTHTSEGYCLTEEDKYNNENFTTDTEMNVVKAGSIIEKILNEKYNINTLHDKTVHDQGYNHNIAYDLSKKTVESIKEEHDSIQLTIDIHRDGAFDGSKKFDPTVEHNGKMFAQVMFVVGCDYDVNNPNPNWRDNFKLAMLMLEMLEEKVPGITRGISMRKDPYNTNLADRGILIEIGFNGNLISEVVNTSEIVADVLGEIYSYEE
jgi:stage II sporulation protein P